MPGQVAPPLVIGPNTAIDVDKDGDFFWREPEATSLAEQREQIREVKELIDQHRAIPACAGRTRPPCHPGVPNLGHPRVCGENATGWCPTPTRRPGHPRVCGENPQ